MTDIAVVTEGLRKHAARVEAVGEDIYDARSAAGQVSMQSEAYGQLCSPILVPVLGLLESAGIASMTVGALAVQATGGAVRAMAASLDIVDDIASGRVSEAGR
jgi:hypothetical protein